MKVKKEPKKETADTDADVADKKRIAGMTDDLVMGALSQHSSIKFDGNSLDIDNVDAN